MSLLKLSILLLLLKHFLVRFIAYDNLFAWFGGNSIAFESLFQLSRLSAYACLNNLIVDVVFHSLAEVSSPKFRQV